jgi:hypothetical protein
MKLGSHKGRILRLFERGQREEASLAGYLRTCGVTVVDGPPEGGQFGFSDCSGHFGGSADGMLSGLEAIAPEVVLDGPGLAEYKTHGEKSFIDLAGKLEDYRKYITNPKLQFPGKGLLSSKPEHYVQMQVYMHYLGLKWGLYVAVCKNTDDLYMEIIYYKEELARQYVDRAGKIIFAQHPPAKITQDPSWWECKFCDFREICHYGHPPAKNCRSCIYAAPVEDGQWACTAFHQIIPGDFIPVGCDRWDPIQ